MQGDQDGGTGRKSASSKNSHQSQILTLIVQFSAKNTDLGLKYSSLSTECKAKIKHFYHRRMALHMCRVRNVFGKLP